MGAVGIRVVMAVGDGGGQGFRGCAGGPHDQRSTVPEDDDGRPDGGGGRECGRAEAEEPRWIRPAARVRKEWLGRVGKDGCNGRRAGGKVR